MHQDGAILDDQLPGRVGAGVIDHPGAVRQPLGGQGLGIPVHGDLAGLEGHILVADLGVADEIALAGRDIVIDETGLVDDSGVDTGVPPRSSSGSCGEGVGGGRERVRCGRERVRLCGCTGVCSGQREGLTVASLGRGGGSHKHQDKEEQAWCAHATAIRVVRVHRLRPGQSWSSRSLIFFSIPFSVGW
ncbi:MAG: hypothetical protein BWY77_00851 [bacterium ADurb.Bin431]|nr:MAG: hypothetical protein BWY77_00851 [bacterium ADurb.Bin431]